MNNILITKLLEDPCNKNSIELKENIIRSKDKTFIHRLNKSLKYALEKLNDYHS